jgi:hypothetical protein
MHLAFKYVSGRKRAFTLYNALLKAGKEVFISYQPDIKKYFIRFYESTTNR